jgi:chaperonin GroES
MVTEVAPPSSVANSAMTPSDAPARKPIHPLGDRVVILPSAHEAMTKSGIVIPDTAKEKPQEGTIVAVGPGRVLDDGRREQMDVRPGDKVLYAKYAGSEFKLQDEDLLIVSQKDLLATIE